MQGGINQYAYTNNNPVNYTDPLGLAAAGPSIFSGGYPTSGANPFASAAPSGQSLVVLAANGVTDPYSVTIPTRGVDGNVYGMHPVPGYSEPSDGLSLGMGVLGMLGAPEVKGAQAVADVVQGVAKTAGQLGREGEAAVRGVYDIGNKESFIINGRTRIPDGVNLKAGTLSEVKNTQYQGFTQQLRDYSGIANQNGFTFDLYTRPGAQLSGPLENAIKSGTINLKYIP